MTRTSKIARQLGYRSGLEVNTSKQLDSIGRKYEYESEKCIFDWFSPVRRGGLIGHDNETIKLPPKTKIIQWHSYTTDFIIWRQDGSPLYIETKGYFKGPDRTKHEAIKKQYPRLDLRIIFTSNGWVTKGKTRYTQWCDKRGIPHYIVTTKDKKEDRIIPQSWLDE